MIVGLTGGIATGKSTFSTELQRLGILVLDADQTAREVTAPESEGLAEIIAAFGREYVLETGELDRARMADLVFSDAEQRERLNAIVHPRVRALMWERAREHVKGDATRIVVLDVPLLIEGDTHKLVDVTVLVYVPELVQVVRLMQRHGWDEPTARQRMDAQLSIEEKRAVADVVLDNSGPLEEVPDLAARLAEVLRRWASQGAKWDGTFDRGVVARTLICS